MRLFCINSLLVISWFDDDKERKVTLPTVEWGVFYSGKPAGESEDGVVSPGLSRIIVFLKNGEFVPVFAIFAPFRNSIF